VIVGRRFIAGLRMPQKKTWGESRRDGQSPALFIDRSAIPPGLQETILFVPQYLVINRRATISRLSRALTEQVEHPSAPLRSQGNNLYTKSPPQIVCSKPNFLDAARLIHELHNNVCTSSRNRKGTAHSEQESRGWALAQHSAVYRLPANAAPACKP
jgi:hypothetical protein